MEQNNIPINIITPSTLSSSNFISLKTKVLIKTTNTIMKLSAVLVVTAGAYRVAAVIGFPLCMAACAPLLNPIAAAACTAGCAALAVGDENETHASPRFLPDGTVVFEKESNICAEACKPLSAQPLPYSAWPDAQL